MIYGYIRVSSDKQTVENQRYEIEKFCRVNNLQIDGWIEETISGIKSPQKRQLGKLLNSVKKDDKIICSELSRLGRNLYMIMDILHYCLNRECMIWTIKDNFRLGEDISSKVLAFAFGLSAEIERQLISQRTKEALARRKAEGMVLGRKKGQRQPRVRRRLYPHEAFITKALAQGVSHSAIARKLHCSRNTLRSYLQLMATNEMGQ